MSLTVLDGNGLSKNLKTHTEGSNLIPEHVMRSGEHQKTHDGELFYATHYESSLADAGTFKFSITVPAGYKAHLRTSLIRATNAPVSAILYTGPTITGAGTGLTERNYDTSAATTIQTAIAQGVTTSADGTEIYRDLLVGAITGGSTEDDEEEIILSANTTYLFTVTNNSGGAVAFLAKFKWYEVAA